MRSVTRSAVMGVWAVAWDDRKVSSSKEAKLMGLSGCMGSVPIFCVF